MWVFSERINSWKPPQKNKNLRLPYTLRFNCSDNETSRSPANPEQDPMMLSTLHKHVTSSLTEGLRTRWAIMQRLLETSGSNTSGEQLITDLQRCNDGWQARLRVNEQHPYFFDHPLDHVPGILLIAGALQMMVQANLINDEQYINKMNVRFINYVDKCVPVNLLTSMSQDGEWTTSVKQQGQIVCVIRITLDTFTPFTPITAVKDVIPCRRIKLLHKQRQENVLVSDLRDEHEHYTVFTTSLPDGHFFAQEQESHLSMVYFLEIARQCYMQFAHDIMQVPLGVPMNLATLNFSLRNPIPRHHTLRISTKKAPLTATNGRTNLINLSLWIGEKQLGDVRIVAQVLEPNNNV